MTIKTDEEYLAEIREKSKKSGTLEHLMYQLLDGAHPTFKESFEKQAVMMVKAATGLAEEFNKAANDPAQREKLSKILDRAAEVKAKNLSPDDSDDTKKEQ